MVYEAFRGFYNKYCTPSHTTRATSAREPVRVKVGIKVDLTLNYEELVIYPALAINLVAETVGRTNVSGMLQSVNSPSWSRKFRDRETNKAIERFDKGFLIKNEFPRLINRQETRLAM